MFSTLNLRALGIATLATLLLVVGVFVGSRNLQNFDAALVPYLIGTLFAAFAIVYRYVVWLQRPPTWRFFKRSFELLFSGKTFAYGWELVKHFIADFPFQRFIAHRGPRRFWGHFLMSWGCMIAFAVTIPLTFGWIHFGLKQGASTPTRRTRSVSKSWSFRSTASSPTTSSTSSIGARGW